jgi:hypothetical protein
MHRPAPESPSLDFAACVHAWVAANAAAGGQPVRNLRTTLATVGGLDAPVPVTINHSEAGNAWVCSPHTAYVRYAAEELRRFGHPLLSLPLQGMCALLGGHLRRARIDDAVAINNWLLSTNVYPRFDGGTLRRWLDEAMQRWPQHAIWFRSLNTRCTPDWLAALESLGCEIIPSRQVYLFDHVDRHARRPRDLARDFALLASRGADVSPAAEWNDTDFERAASLYGLLYLEKYSRLNPDYGAQFLRCWHAQGLLALRGYRDGDGQLEAVVGTFGHGNTITAPIVGYDTARPMERGLYRLLMADVLDHAARARLRLNLSAGAAGFKRSRGGSAVMEFSAVHCRHLPRRRRRALAMLRAIGHRVGVPIMQRFEL